MVDDTIGRKWALIIGINNYIDSNITPLQYAVNDAYALYECLTDNEYGCFEASKTKLLTDKTEIKPTRSEILKAINGLQIAEVKDSVFIFFAGHGIEKNGESYLVKELTRGIGFSTGVRVDLVVS